MEKELPSYLPTEKYEDSSEESSFAIASIFNPFQKAPKSYSDYRDKSIDKLKKFPLITVIGGYHNIRSHTSNTLLSYLAPNARLIIRPDTAVEEGQHFGLGTYVTNPFAPLASLLAHACHSLDDENKVGLAFLMIPTVPLVILALLIDAIKMLITYVALAIPAAVAYPIMNYMDKHKELDDMVGGALSI